MNQTAGVLPALVLGPRLVGEKLQFSENRVLLVERLLDEGGFSFVYLVSDLPSHSSGIQYPSSDNSEHQDSNINNSSSSSHGNHPFIQSVNNKKFVLKVTAVQNQEQREIAQKEAMLLKNLSHPSIVQLLDAKTSSSQKMQQHMLLMEYLSEGHAFSVISNMSQNNQRFTLSNLILAFGQISNAVSYLHAQKPPIVHRDLKLENFLVGPNQRYKLCDFGSAILGHVSLTTSYERSHAEMIIQKTTTQMYRAPEMVDLYMCPKLTQATDVWALGCCLYAMAFFKNCFEAEGVSINLAILSGNYKIPTDSPYGEALSELIRRMLTLNSEKRADMREVIKGLSAVYAGKPLKQQGQQQSNINAAQHQQATTNNPNIASNNLSTDKKEKREERFGVFRCDGQGQISSEVTPLPAKPVAKKLDPNSAAARRKAGRSSKNNNAVNAAGIESSTNVPPVDDTAAFSQLSLESFSPNRVHRQPQPKTGQNSLLLQTPYRLKKLESCGGASQASSITSVISKEFDELDDASFCFDDSVASNPFAFIASLNNMNNYNDSADDPFHFEDISCAATSSSVNLNSNYRKHNTNKPKSEGLDSNDIDLGFCTSRADVVSENSAGISLVSEKRDHKFDPTDVSLTYSI